MKRLFRSGGGRDRYLARLVAVALTVAFVALRGWDPAPLQILRLKTFDLYQRLAPRAFVEAPVVIVDLDEESLAAYGQWPWPRALVARLLDRLTALGAAAVGFDIVFAEPDRLSPARLGEGLVGIDSAVLAALARLPDGDRLFAEALRRGRAVLGQAMLTRSPDRGGAAPPARQAAVAEIGGDPRPALYAFAGTTRNLPALESAAAGLGSFTLRPEIDGLVRRVPLITRVGETLFPALVVEMLRVAVGASAIAVASDKAGVKWVKIGRRIRIPTDAQARAWINYAPHDRRRYVSAKAVLDGEVAPNRIKGRLVLVGTSAAGLLDIKATPIDDAMPGVEIHAQLLETILSGAYLKRPGYALGIEATALALVLMVLTWAIGRIGAVWSLLAVAAIVGVLVAGAWALYVGQGVLVDVAYLTIATLSLYGLLTYLHYVREQAARRQVRDAFARYMSPALVEQLAAHPERLKLGGEMREMTVLFCDIRGFTGISEQFKADPEGLTRLINRFLTPMTDLILDRRGTIDKYMGDCIMAFWNAPLDDPDHARHGCASALAMMEGITALNVDLAAEAEAAGRPHIPIRVGIGLNSGECCVGNMGSEQRFDYSVLGDDVNLASRLEGQSKTYGVDIVIGEATRTRARDFATLELDLIRVKGKDEAVRVFALLGDEALADDPAFTALAARHDEMLAAYRRQDWADARRFVAECRPVAASGLAALYDLYETRIATYEADPPGADWDGVFVATSK